MQYEVHKSLAGKTVSYRCPHCGEMLKSKLQEAGTKDTCPGCGGHFMVPGKREWIAEQAQERKKKEEKEHRHLEKLQQQIAHKSESSTRSPAAVLPVAELDAPPRRQPVGRRSLPRSRSDAPVAMALPLRILAITFTVIGGIVILIGLFGLVKVLTTNAPNWQIKAIATGPPLMMMVGGLFNLAFAAILETLRHLAISAWHIRRNTEMLNNPR